MGSVKHLGGIRHEILHNSMIFYTINTFRPSRIFGPDFDRISTRIIVLCLFIVFGSHVQIAKKYARNVPEFHVMV